MCPNEMKQVYIYKVWKMMNFDIKLICKYNYNYMQ